MRPKHVKSTIFLNENKQNVDYIVFKTAISFAKIGLSVWIISQKPFESVPEHIEAPEKEILQLITFIYLNDSNKLITHMNGVHIWHKIPTVVIIKEIDEYCDLFSEDYLHLKTAFTITSILDGVAACSNKIQRDCYLLVTCQAPESQYCKRLNNLYNLYFDHVIKEDTEKNVIIKSIVDKFQNNNENI